MHKMSKVILFEDLIWGTKNCKKLFNLNKIENYNSRIQELKIVTYLISYYYYKLKYECLTFNSISMIQYKRASREKHNMNKRIVKV